MPSKDWQKLAEVLDAAFERDWEIARSRGSAPSIQRKSSASSDCHLLWTLHRWTKNQIRNDLGLGAPPIDGDGMPSIHGSPRRWRLVRGELRIRASDYEYLRGGPLFGENDELLIDPDPAIAPADSPPSNIQRAVDACADAWEFVEIGGSDERQIRHRAGDRSTKWHVETLYYASKLYAASAAGIVYPEPIVRDHPPILVPPRRYMISKGWRLDSGSTHLLDKGPLYAAHGGILVEADPSMTTRINPEEIDSFSNLGDVQNTAVDELLARGYLAEYSEADVKIAIHLILGDDNVRKDWGGEIADVISLEVVLGGRRVITAMALKGPSARRNITIASYGKNGDQIVRLFAQDAELYVVQANGFFDGNLITHVAQTARAQGRSLLYCLIDGRDTARLLVAYADLLGEA